MTKKRRRGAKRRQPSLVGRYWIRFWAAATWLPKYLRERFRLNRAIYFGRNSLRANVRSNNRKIDRLAILYRMATVHLPYTERELGFGTDRARDFAGPAAQSALALAVPSRWETPRLTRSDWFAAQAGLYEIGGDWVDRFYRFVWLILAAPIKLIENLLAAEVRAAWFVYVRLLRHPSNRSLTYLRDRLTVARTAQEVLIELLESILKRTGEETKIETRARNLREAEAEAHRQAEEQDRRERFQTARRDLARAYKQLLRSHRSEPITAGTHLDFDAVRTFVREALAEAAELAAEEQSAPAENFIAALNTATEYVQSGFRTWAQAVAKEQDFYGRVMESLDLIEEEYGEFNPPPQAVEISSLLRRKVPELWGDAQWHELKIKLADIHEMTDYLAEIARNYRTWGDKAKTVQRRVDEMEKIRAELLDQKGEEARVVPSQKWLDAWNAFVAEATEAFAKADWGTLEWALEKIEEPLKDAEFKVTSMLERMNRLIHGTSALAKDQADTTRGAGTRHARARFARKGDGGEETPKPRTRTIGGKSSLLRPALDGED